MGNLKFQKSNFIRIYYFHSFASTCIWYVNYAKPLATNAGTDGWISIILGWIVTSIIGVFIILMLQKNPNKNFSQILKTYFGKWIGTILFSCICLLSIFCWI
ncbi:GerAB/ArcD/ProY family transporter [Bacillus cereus]